MSVCKIGYLGIGKYNSCENGKETRCYQRWVSMIERCYSEKSLIKRPSYIDCSVAPEWHNFQNFAEWYYLHYNNDYQLDKDILVKGNKIYSPDTCCFVPKEINLLVVNHKKFKRGIYPIGVKINDSGRFMARTRYKSLGTFDTIDKAFEAYKNYKESLIKTTAKEYFEKDLITEKVYTALLNYEINAND